MNRRSSSVNSQSNAIARTISLDLPLATTLSNPKNDWMRIASGPGRMRLAHKIDVDWKEFTLDKYLFSHCSIVASVDTEENGYWLKPACNELVNSNGNAWTNKVLLATFKTFIGAENYLEHCQVPELSKGKILDAVLRPLEYVDKEGRKANIYYCDILVATNRKHGSLVKKIAGGELTTMSMGCTCNHVTCSQCGRVIEGDNDNCKHISNELGGKFADKNGVLRVTSELCGRTIKNKDGEVVGDPKSVFFIEASWVANPAFTGAVLNHYVSDIKDLKVASKYAEWSSKKLAYAVEDIFKMRVADKNGMLCLRVAQNEIARRMREDRVERIASLII